MLNDGVWKEGRPTEPGFYWLLFSGHTDISPMFAFAEVKVAGRDAWAYTVGSEEELWFGDPRNCPTHHMRIERPEPPKGIKLC